MSYLETTAKIMEIIALGFGIWWAIWNLFVRRELTPKCDLDHRFYTRNLGDGNRLVTVTVLIRNRGNKELVARNGYVRIQRVFPVAPPPELAEPVARGETPLNPGETFIPWCEIGKRFFGVAGKPIRIEPGESDCLPCDFVIPDGVLALLAYSYIPNPESDVLGWTFTTTHDLDN